MIFMVKSEHPIATSPYSGLSGKRVDRIDSHEVLEAATLEECVTATGSSGHAGPVRGSSPEPNLRIRLAGGRERRLACASGEPS